MPRVCSEKGFYLRKSCSARVCRRSRVAQTISGESAERSRRSPRRPSPGTRRTSQRHAEGGSGASSPPAGALGASARPAVVIGRIVRNLAPALRSAGSPVRRGTSGPTRTPALSICTVSSMPARRRRSTAENLAVGPLSPSIEETRSGLAISPSRRRGVSWSGGTSDPGCRRQ